MSKAALIAAGLALAGVPAAAQQGRMSVADFLVRADALQAKGMRALFSKDMGVLKAEIQSAGRAVRAEQEAALKAGRKPATCLPKKASTSAKEIMTHFRSIPAAERGMSVKQGFAGLMSRKYPCG